MAEVTSNYNLKKPSDDDFYNVQDFNDNADIVDCELKNQSDRMASIENPNFVEAENDNNIQSKESFVGILGKIKRAITRLTEHINSGNPHSDSSPKNHTHLAATQTSNGFLSKTDKTKLDGIGEGANKTVVDETLKSNSANPVQNKEVYRNISMLGKSIDEVHDLANDTWVKFSNHAHVISDVSGLGIKLDEKQNDLGFTPIQQGGGADQKDNKIYLGWTGTQLKMQVDETDMGAVITTSTANNAILPINKGGTGATSNSTALENLGLRKLIKLEANERKDIYFTTNTSGLVCVTGTSSENIAGLWYFCCSSYGTQLTAIKTSSLVHSYVSVKEHNIGFENTDSNGGHHISILLFNGSITEIKAS